MPRIPRVEPEPTPQPRLRQPVPTADFEGAGRTGEAISTLAHVSAQIRETELYAETQRAATRDQAALLEFHQALELDGEPEKHEQKIASEISRVMGAGSPKLTGRFRQIYEDEMLRFTSRLKLETTTRSLEMRNERIRAMNIEAIGTSLRNAEAAPTEELRASHIASALTTLEATKAAYRPEELAHLKESIRAQVENGDFRAEAQELEDHIVASTAAPRERLTRARAIQDAKLRDEVVERVQRRNTEDEFYASKAKSDKEEHEERRFDDLVSRIIQGEDVDIKDIPRDLAGGRQAALEQMLLVRAKREALPFDYAQYEQLLSLPVEDMAAADIQPIRTLKDAEGKERTVSLASDPELYQAVIRRRAEARRGVDDPVNAAALNRMIAEKKAVHALDDERAGRGRRAAARAFAQFSAAHGNRSLTETEMQGIIDGLFTPKSPAFFADDPRFSFDADTDPLEGIDDADIEQARTALIEAGVVPTPANILAAIRGAR